MPNFDCGGERCGRFSCASCTDEATQAEYWNLLRTVRDDAEADRIMRERLAKKRARATKSHDEVARLRAENKRLRSACENAVNKCPRGCTPGWYCGVCGILFAAIAKAKGEKP